MLLFSQSIFKFDSILIDLLINKHSTMINNTENTVSKESKESKESKGDHSSETPGVTHYEEPVEIIAVEAKKPSKPKKIKCHHCQKTLKLMQQIQCQCNHLFCPQHMNRHSHNCPFNMKQTIKDSIEKNNPKIHVKMTDKI
tara:strand:- start:65 stop:487 length:423 start_codon:yes stop_codon:yes gene_type:complete